MARIIFALIAAISLIAFSPPPMASAETRGWYSINCIKCSTTEDAYVIGEASNFSMSAPLYNYLGTSRWFYYDTDRHTDTLGFATQYKVTSLYSLDYWNGGTIPSIGS